MVQAVQDGKSALESWDLVFLRSTGCSVTWHDEPEFAIVSCCKINCTRIDAVLPSQPRLLTTNSSYITVLINTEDAIGSAGLSSICRRRERGLKRCIRC